MSTQPAPVPKYDLAPDTAAKLAELQARVPGAVKAAEAISVKDDQTEERAIVARKMLKNHEADAEKARTREVAPHNAFVKEVNAAFKKIADAIGTAIGALDQRLLSYRREKQRRIDEENRRIAAGVERQRQEAEERAAEEAKAAGNFSPAETQEYAAAAAQEVQARAPVPEAAKTTRTDFGAASYPQVLDYEITDLPALVTVYPDIVEVKRGKVLELGRAAEKLGPLPADGRLPFVPGVRFFKRDSVSGR